MEHKTTGKVVLGIRIRVRIRSYRIRTFYHNPNPDLGNLLRKTDKFDNSQQNAQFKNINSLFFYENKSLKRLYLVIIGMQPNTLKRREY
jgi:hypothetical protein